MALDVSLPSLVNAAGAFLFLVVGLAILWVAGRERMGQLVGGLAVAFGLTFVLQNIFILDAALPALAVALTSLSVTVFAIALTAHLARGLSRGAMATLWLLGLAEAVLHLVLAVEVFSTRSGGPTLGVEPSLMVDTAFVLLNVGTESLVLPLTAAALAGRGSRAEEPMRRRALSLLALSTGLFVVFSHTAILFPVTLLLTPVSPTITAVRGIVVLLIVPLALWIPSARSHDAPLMTRTLLALVAAGLAGLASPTLGFEDFGPFGIVRTIGVALLVVAVVRYDLLGVPLPRFATHRGALAAGTLAIMFIVAQVAQNFLSAQYGLLLGGVIAGAFLFAAQPIQRAIEGARASAPAPLPDERAARRRELYATAVRAALADHVLTREEERALAHLAEELGIGAGEAHDIRAAAAEAARR